MITPYLRPQDTITQILQQTAESSTSRRRPIVIGPQHNLYLNDGRDLSGALVSFNAVGDSDLDYTDADGDAINLASEVPVESSAGLYGSGLMANVATFVAGWTVDTTDATRRTIRIDSDLLKTTGSASLNAALDGRSVKVGDYIKVSSSVGGGSSFTVTRRVVSLVLKSGSSSGYDGVVLDGTAVNAADAVSSIDIDTVDIFQSFTGSLSSDNLAGVGDLVTLSDETWEYAASIGLPSSVTGLSTFKPFSTNYGGVALTYKTVVQPSATESYFTFTSEDGITDTLGEGSINNWLSRGALEAFRGNQNVVVCALRTEDDSVEAFTKALKKIKTTDQIYALVGLTDRLDVMKLLRDHCETMSNKYNKNFRRLYVGTDSPGSYSSWGESESGDYRTASLSMSIVTLSAEDQVTSQFSDADVGAAVDIGSYTGTIVDVISTSEVLTDISSVSSVDDAALTVTRADTETSQAAFVEARSKALSSRRVVNVWCDNPLVDDGDGNEVLPCKFLAAEVAGLRCALLPQQGLTMTEISSVDSAPSMYTVFDQETLDEIASNGTLVVTQETEGGDVFIRHQLTTSTSEGALAYEDNVGVIVDEFSYDVKDVFREYIGRRNGTADTIAEIDDKLKTIASEYTETSITAAYLGPAVSSFYDENGNEGEVTVRQDGDLSNTLMTYVKLRVPLPLSGINHYIDVDVVELLASEDN